MKLFVFAMEKEAATILAYSNVRSEERLGYCRYCSCTYNNVNFAIAISGIGKAFAAACLAAVMERHGEEIDAIYNLGVGGATSDLAPIGSFVAATCSIEHDLDTVALGDPLAFVSGIEMIEFPSDKRLLENAKNAAVIEGFPFVEGVISSGDAFLTDQKEIDKVKELFGSLSLDMESAPFAQIAYVYHKPYLAMRCISDNGDGAEYAANMPLCLARIGKLATHLIKE